MEAGYARVQLIYDAGETPALHTRCISLAQNDVWIKRRLRLQAGRPALQVLNKDCCSALAELYLGVMSCRRFRFAPPTVIYVTRLRRLHVKMKL